MKKQFILMLLLLGIFRVATAETTNESLKFDELYRLLRTHGSNLSEAELNRAAVQGLLQQLQSQVVLATNSSSAATVSNLLSKVSVLETSFGYFRISRIESGLNDHFKVAYQKITSTNKLKGLVLDLRYANGTDYAASAKTADMFIKTKQSLLRWGESSANVTPKTNAIEIPVAILINHQTSGAAEALAGMLREAQIGLVIGTNSAGQASVFKEFSLSNGQRLKIASAPVKFANGKEIPSEGLKPDIEIPMSAEDEKAFYENSYRTLPRGVAASSITNNLSGGTDTNVPRRRLNEAELVRLQREGTLLDQDFSPRELLKESASGRANGDSKGPTLSDPVLVRALDLLKGLAVIQRTKRF